MYFKGVDGYDRLSSIHKSSTFFKKEYGLDTTLQVLSMLRWKEPNKDTFFTSPLLIQPCSITKSRKIDTEFTISSLEEDSIIVNPILVHSLKRFYDVDIDDIDVGEVADKIISDLSTKNTVLTLSEKWHEDDSWQIINCLCIGNFNYKKSLLGTDYEQIKRGPSQSIRELFYGQEKNQIKSEANIQGVLNLDFSQREAIVCADRSHLALQGPPGTGKSHTIVGLIGHFLSKNKKILFVSQKKSALEVVLKRLEEIQLDHLAAYLNTEKNEKKSFYGKLAKSWKTLSEGGAGDRETKLYMDNLISSYYLHNYSSPDSYLGDSPFNIVKGLLKLGFLKKKLQSDEDIPSLIDWKKSEKFLIDFEANLKSQFSVKYISNCQFIYLNKAVFSEKDPLVKLEQRLTAASATLSEIIALQKKYNIEEDLTNTTKLALAASILAMVNKTQLDLLNVESKSYKSFSNAAKKYHLLKSRVSRAELANSKWVNKPTKAEITELIDLLKHSHAPKGILGILKRRNDRLLKAFEGFDNNLSNVGKLQLLEELRSEWNLKGELAELEVKLKHNFNISDPEIEIRQILQLRNKLNEVSHNVYMHLLEHNNSICLIDDLSKIHSKIQQYNHIIKFVFDTVSGLNLVEEQKRLVSMKKQLFDFKIILPQLEQYFSLPLKLRKYVSSNAKSIAELSASCMYINLIESSRFETAYSKLSGDNLKHELDGREELVSDSNQLNIDLLQLQYFNKFKQFEDLLSTPASKLKGDQKEWKKELRQHKKTFIHEINKKQQHMPIKRFVEENWSFISQLVPLWIMNPLSVSERLNCEKEKFDVVIFDEASQIPIEDAVPAIHRAKQIIVVGDEKQMPPSSFFSSVSGSYTILDQANEVFEKRMLKWHYRSENPALIDFSNRYFYENELITIPPVDKDIPIDLIKCDGVFDEGVNEKEAVEIANYLSLKTTINEEDYAVIAFSKEQENRIRFHLEKLGLDCEKLLIRNLENVQGIERDNVLISIGYAKNSDGKFRLNFGPVNQENGINRLNVMFTRAKKRIVLFSSIISSDFGVSENQGVSCLRDYLRFAENPKLKEAEEMYDSLYLIDVEKFNLTTYSYRNGSSVNCYIQHSSSKVLLLDPCITTSESKDLYTVYSVLKRRFKKVKILLSIDAWNNPEYFENEVKVFFQ